MPLLSSQGWWSLLSPEQHPIASAVIGTTLSVLLWLLLVAVAYIVNYKLTIRAEEPFLGLQVPPGRHWLMGHLMSFGGNFADTFLRIYVDHANSNGQSCVYMGMDPCVSVLNWKDARTVLFTEVNRQSFLMFHHHVSQFAGTKSIILLNGREWKTVRSITVKAFSGPSIMKRLQETIPKVMNDLIQAIKDKHFTLPDGKEKDETSSVVLEINKVTKMITVDIFGAAALSHDFGCCKRLVHADISKSFDHLNSELGRRLYQPLNPFRYFYSIPTRSNREYIRERRRVRSFLRKLVLERHSGTNKHDDYISRVLEAALSEQDGSKKGYFSSNSGKPSDVVELVNSGNIEPLIDLLLTLLFAGYDTTSTTLTYAMYLVATHPEVEKNCLEEINLSSWSKSENGSVSGWSDDDFVYCNAVIMETLRMFPPAPIIQRCVQRNMVLSGGLEVPKGTAVYVPVWCIQRSEQVFARPNEFLPGRWVERKTSKQTTSSLSPWVERSSNEEQEIKVEGSSQEQVSTPSEIPAGNRKALFAFSGGARSCAGQRFATKEALGVFAGLLKDLKFTPIDGYEMIPERCGVLHTPKGGLPMNVQLRDKKKTE